MPRLRRVKSETVSTNIGLDKLKPGGAVCREPDYRYDSGFATAILPKYTEPYNKTIWPILASVVKEGVTLALPSGRQVNMMHFSLATDRDWLRFSTLGNAAAKTVERDYGYVPFFETGIHNDMADTLGEETNAALRTYHRHLLLATNSALGHVLSPLCLSIEFPSAPSPETGLTTQ